MVGNGLTSGVCVSLRLLVHFAHELLLLAPAVGIAPSPSGIGGGGGRSGAGPLLHAQNAFWSLQSEQITSLQSGQGNAMSSLHLPHHSCPCGGAGLLFGNFASLLVLCFVG